MHNYIAIILLSGVVTWLPRIIPFVFSKKLVFPEKFTLFLGYLPVCILCALFFQSLLTFREGQFPMIKGKEILACLPALVVGYYTKDLMKIVVTGVVAMAVIRFFF